MSHIACTLGVFTHILRFRTTGEIMQASISADDDPFHGGHEPRTPLVKDKKGSDDAEYASGSHTHQPSFVEAKDTFANTSVLQTDAEVVNECRKDPPVKPGPGAHRMELLDYIKQQLDCYGKEPLLMNRYQLLGPDHRAAGGNLSLLASDAVAM
jgi:hypothetical protein